MRLKDKVCLITGAAQGIGYACAHRFAREGAKVMIADINGPKGEAAAGRLRAEGLEAAFTPCDVGDKGDVEAMIARTVETYGGLDVTVVNAAILHVADFLELQEDDFDRVVRVNLKGFFLTGQAAEKRMVAQGRGGAIINMSSVNAVMAIPSITSYVVCKGGVNQLTKAMALALAGENIRVNAIGPGTILTELAQGVMADEAARERILARTPLGRLGEPDEVASVAVFLASEESSYITGQTIYADGGRLALNYTVPVAAP